MNIQNKIKKGVIHIGAHTGQEREYYMDFNVLWIEPLPDVNNFLASCGFELIADFPYKINNTQRDNIYRNKL